MALCTVTSRVISPRYPVWLVTPAAVRRCLRGSPTRAAPALVLAAAAGAVLVFPVCLADAVLSGPLGLAPLSTRDGLPAAAAVSAARALRRATLPRAAAAEPLSPAAPAGTPATAR
ncbi:hypothetical protein ABZ858_01885 [Streptomyces sp. NPDC047017]|uniref:hypothetical protein n=1 Tax=Streptomyces sp. NPDC047017 TaxID=3155024 RepID=UPI003402209D